MDTQWRTAGMAGVYTGLDYGQIEPTARLCGIAIEPRQPLFLHLRTLEAEALKSWAEQRARAR